jgi:hypothetical protein
MFIIKAIELEGRTIKEHEPFSPAYVKDYHPEAHEGQGSVDFTNNIFEAKLFEQSDELWSFIYQVPANRPLRTDGSPNRPITAFTLEVFAMEKQK